MTKSIVAAVVFLGILPSVSAHAQEPTPVPTVASAAPATPAAKTSRYGVAGGFLLPGSIYSDPPDDDIETEMSLMIRGMGDWKVADKMTAGLFLTYVSLSYEETFGIDVPDQWLEAGGHIRFIVQAQPNLAIRPGLQIGYRTIGGSDDLDDITGMGLNLSVEIEYQRASGIWPYADVGFTTQPVGGNDDADVSWGPIFYLTGGVVF